MAQLSLKQGSNPLKCVLVGNTANISILAATASAQAPTTNDLSPTIANDGKSFTVPLDTVGTWAVEAVVNLFASPSTVLKTGNDETKSDGTDLPTGTFIDAFDDPATLAAGFTLDVVA
jgi:hypothetical protein